MTAGSCLCGAVRYEVAAPYQWMAHCHCSMCRKHNGTLYATSVGVAPKNFRWLQGQDAIAHYRSSLAFERPFCRHCGSTVPDATGEVCVCPAGTFDDDLEMKPQAHIFAASKSPMCEITDALQQFDEYPPGFGSAVSAPAHAAALTESDAVQGSCLCGAVAFEIEAVPPRLVNCHCSRCRRSRGAAHGTNFFASLERLHWTRGAEKVRTYKLPDASLFTTGFCADCGSLMPSVFEALRRYLVPVGSIDTPLAIKPATHIYVGSKAAWFDITDALPQFEAMPPRERVRELVFCEATDGAS